MTTYEQQAQELAHKAALKCYGENIGDDAETILRELSLVALLEDKARLDWLEHGANLHKMDQTSVKLKDYKLETWDYRTAITNAMKETPAEKEKEK